MRARATIGFIGGRQDAGDPPHAQDGVRPGLPVFEIVQQGGPPLSWHLACGTLRMQHLLAPTYAGCRAYCRAKGPHTLAFLTVGSKQPATSRLVGGAR